MRRARCALLVLLSAQPALGADLCVKSGGSDATAKGSIVYVAGNEAGSTCWATVGRAVWGQATRTTTPGVAAAVAGDTVYVFGATYGNTTASVDDEEFDVLYNPVNAGSSGSPIVLHALAAVTLTSTSWTGPVIGTFGKNYIHWTGPWTLNDANISLQPETGSIVVYGSTGSKIDGAIVTGTTQAWVTNYNGVRLEQAIDPIIRNVTCTGIHLNPDGHNAACLMLYDTNGALVEYNNFSASNAGIYEKGAHGVGFPDQERNVFRGNKLFDLASAVVITASDDAEYTQNILYGNAGYNFKINTLGGGPNNLTVANNTIHGGDNTCIVYNGAPTAGWTNVRYYNNICSAARIGTGSEDFAAIDANSATGFHEHNVYHGLTDVGSDDIAHFGVNEYSLAEWNGLGQDAAAPASITSDPLFTNAAGRDYTLGALSPARSLGVDIADLDSDANASECTHAGAHQTGSEVFGVGGSGAGVLTCAAASSGTTRLRLTPGEED